MIDASSLSTGIELGRFDPESLREAWREAHFAGQAAAEVGKSWAVEEPDDSHGSLAWVGAGNWRGLEGLPAAGTKPHRARLRFENLELSLDDGRGGTVASLSLPGHTLAEAMEWIVSACERELGPRRQPSRPAPDLPDHPIADGAAFATSQESLSNLAEIYAGTARMLANLRCAAPAFGESRCWPHHFDLASLAVVATDAEGDVTRSVGVGVTPPDSVEPAGYWYVSPWMKEGSAVKLQFPRLSIGRWIDTDALAMAALPVSDLSNSQDRPAALAAFVAEAVNACMEIGRN